MGGDTTDEVGGSRSTTPSSNRKEMKRHAAEPLTASIGILAVPAEAAQNANSPQRGSSALYSDSRTTCLSLKSPGDLEREVDDSATRFIVALHQVSGVPLVAIETVGAVEVLGERHAAIECHSCC